MIGSKVELTKLAGALSFQPPHLEKVLRLTELLSEFQSEAVLRKNLALKGGTALNVYHLHVPRLSVDADFNYVGSAKKDETDRVRPEVDRLIQAVAKEMGYAVTKNPFRVASQSYSLRYTGFSGNLDQVKVEVNFLDRVPSLGIEERKPWDALGVESAGVPCLSLPELAGMKIATLCSRGLARDLFDVAMVSTIDADKKAIRKIALFQSLLNDVTLADMDTTRHHSITERNLEAQLTYLLRRKEKPTLAEMVKRADSVVSDLTPLHEEEKAVLQDLKRKIWDAARFFKGIDFNRALQDHPGIHLRLHGPVVPAGSNVRIEQ